MQLKDYLQTNRQAALARALGVTPGAVSQWASGETKLTAERCIQIEEATLGQVRCEDMRPDVNWAYIRGARQAQEAWPELADAPTADTTTQTEQGAACPLPASADAAWPEQQGA